MPHRRDAVLKFSVETNSLLIIAYPLNDCVIISSKYGTFSHSMRVEAFYALADHVVKQKKEQLNESTV